MEPSYFGLGGGDGGTGRERTGNGGRGEGAARFEGKEGGGRVCLIALFERGLLSAESRGVHDGNVLKGRLRVAQRKICYQALNMPRSDERD